LSSHSVRVFCRLKQIEAKSAHGASAIECCYAAAERRELSTVTNLAKSKNTNVAFRTTKKYIATQKISLNVRPLTMREIFSSRLLLVTSGNVFFVLFSSVSSRKTSREADSGATVQYHSRTASVCATAVLQLKMSNRRTCLQQFRSLLLFPVIVRQRTESGRYPNVPVMPAPHDRNGNQPAGLCDRLRLNSGKGCVTV